MSAIDFKYATLGWIGNRRVILGSEIPQTGERWARFYGTKSWIRVAPHEVTERAVANDCPLTNKEILAMLGV